MLGAACGLALSFLVRSLFEQALWLDLPTSVSLGTVASGIAVGVGATLIFGLLPIVRTSEVRPLVALREQGAGMASAPGRSLSLLFLLGMLFFALALSILGSFRVTVAVVVASGLVLALLAGVFTVVASLISVWPVPSLRRAGSLLALVPPLLVGLVLLRVAAGFGALLLLAVAGGVLVALLPRSARAAVQLALRNIGRARVRSAVTLLALFVGVFAIGLGLLLGQDLKDFFASRNAAVNQDDAYVLVASASAPAVAAQVALLPNVTHEQTSLAVPDRILAVNGVAVAATPQARTDSTLSAVDGFDLAAGQLPPALLEQGVRDSQPGRLLTAQDAGTLNALFPVADSEAPQALKLGDQVSVRGLGERHADAARRRLLFRPGHLRFSDRRAGRPRRGQRPGQHPRLHHLRAACAAYRGDRRPATD